MHRLSWLNGCWMSVAVAMLPGCSVDINPQPEPPGLGPQNNGNVGGSTATAGAIGGGYNMATGGYLSTGGAENTAGAGNASGAYASGGASYQSAGGASSVDTGGDGGLDGDASDAGCIVRDELYDAGAQFPVGNHVGLIGYPECMPSCGPGCVPGHLITTEALPAGHCDSEPPCQMPANASCRCPGHVGALSGYLCECVSNRWSCTNVQPGAGACAVDC